MLKITLWRIIKSGWQSFVRNYWLSAATVAVMIMALFMIVGIPFLNVLAQAAASYLDDKTDISASFNKGTEENKILQVRQELMELPEVKSVEYVSQDEAIKKFQEKHKKEEVLMQSLQELDQNPLKASLNIKANNASQYETISNYLSQDRFQGLISKINFYENKDLLDRLTRWTRNIQLAGFVISLFLILLAVLVSFNTIRLTMYTWRDEISVMRFVGAGNWFIRGPFLVEGALYGITAAVTTIILIFPILYFISPKITNFLPEVDLLYFYQVNFWQFLFLLFGIGILIGGVSSLIAIRRYLRA